MFNHLPDEALAEIKEHILERVFKAERGRKAFFEKEDAITAMILSNLVIDEWQHSSNGLKWRIQVHQPGAYGDFGESKVGADGIIQIVIYDKSGRLLESKGLLFQAKKTTNRDPNIFKQIENMTTAVGAKGSAIFFYDRNLGFIATGLAEDGEYNLKNKTLQKLDKFIAEEFLGCHVGIKGVRYDSRSNMLIRPNANLHDITSNDLRNRAEIIVERERY